MWFEFGKVHRYVTLLGGLEEESSSNASSRSLKIVLLTRPENCVDPM